MHELKRSCANEVQRLDERVVLPRLVDILGDMLELAELCRQGLAWRGHRAQAEMTMPRPNRSGATFQAGSKGGGAPLIKILNFFAPEGVLPDT